MYEDDGEYMIQVWTDQDTTNKTIQLILQGIVPKSSWKLSVIIYFSVRFENWAEK